MAGNLVNPSYPRFHGALTAVAQDVARGNERFPARNMLLDEGVNIDRATPYLNMAEPRVASKAWTEVHGDYMKSHIWLSRGKAHHGLDPVARQHADTFSIKPDYSRYGSALHSLTLVRCEDPRLIYKINKLSASSVLNSEGDLLELIRNFLAKRNDPQLREKLQAELDIYAEHADARPIFAAFEEDLQTDLDDNAKWQDNLRNALGLSPLRKGDQVILLQYPVARVPPVPGSPSVRALVTPTVLDNSLSNAFCPSPANTETGHTVHLAPEDFNPCREVLHPWIKWQVDDIKRMGEIRTPPPAGLDQARAFHLLALRELTGQSAYADDTDADLLS